MNAVENTAQPETVTEYAYSFANQIKRGKVSLKHLQVGYLKVLKLADEGRWLTECLYCPQHRQREFSTDELLSTEHSTCGCKKTLREDFPEYAIWKQARNRCRNQNHRDYANYGGRGIAFDPCWDDFAVFFRHLGPKFGPPASLERRNNDGPYSPSNCIWANPAIQAHTRSKRGTRKAEKQQKTASNRTNWMDVLTQQELLESAIRCDEIMDELDRQKDYLYKKMHADAAAKELHRKYWDEVLPKLKDEGNRYQCCQHDLVKRFDRHHYIEFASFKAEKSAKRRAETAKADAERMERLRLQQRDEKLASLNPVEREAYLRQEEIEQKARERKVRIDAMTWEEYAASERLFEPSSPIGAG